MKRLRLFFAILLLLTALPLWRYLDILGWFPVGNLITAIFFFIWGTFCLVLPLALINRKLLIPSLLINLVLAWIINSFHLPYSQASYDEPEARHCSLINFAGLIYPMRSIVPAAHEDDLMIRNQICWARKISKTLPQDIQKDDLPAYQAFINDKLTLPNIKWKTTLPFFLPIFFTINQIDPLMDTTLAQKFWNEHYTAEVQSRDYNFLSFPHSDYIKWEYRFLEKYWPDFVENIEIINPE